MTESPVPSLIAQLGRMLDLRKARGKGLNGVCC